MVIMLFIILIDVLDVPVFGTERKEVGQEGETFRRLDNICSEENDVTEVRIGNSVLVENCYDNFSSIVIIRFVLSTYLN